MEGLSPSQFADKLGVQRSGVSHLLAGRNKPSFEFISKMMAAYPKLNPDWLIMGTGKAYRDMASQAEISASAPSYPSQESDLQADLPDALLQENAVNTGGPDLFSAPQQTIAPSAPTQQPAVEPQPATPLPAAQTPKSEQVMPPAPAKSAPENRTKPLPVAPAPGKRIAQITILYTDGTYEVR